MNNPSEMSGDQIADQIGAEFVRLLKIDLSPAEVMAVQEINATLYADLPNVCASHNFCDANMPMLEAFQTVTGRTPETDQDFDLWGAAWQRAHPALCRAADCPPIGDAMLSEALAWGQTVGLTFSPDDLDGLPEDAFFARAEDDSLPAAVRTGAADWAAKLAEFGAAMLYGTTRR